MRKEKKFLSSNERKLDVMLNKVLMLHGKTGLNSIKVIAIIVLILLVCFTIFIIPRFKNFFQKDITEINKGDETKEYYQVLQDGSKVNTSQNIEDYTALLNGIKFSNIKVTENEGLTDLEIDYENTLNSDVQGFGIKLNFYNSKNELVYYYSVMLPENIKASEKDKIYTNILEEYAGIKNIKIEIDSEL